MSKGHVTYRQVVSLIYKSFYSMRLNQEPALILILGTILELLIDQATWNINAGLIPLPQTIAMSLNQSTAGRRGRVCVWEKWNWLFSHNITPQNVFFLIYHINIPVITFFIRGQHIMPLFTNRFIQSYGTLKYVHSSYYVLFTAINCYFLTSNIQTY